MVSKDQRAAHRAQVAAEQASRDADPMDPVGLAVDDLAGRRQWKRSRLGFLTGVGTIRDGVNSVVDGGKESAGRIRTLGIAALFGMDRQGRAVDPNVVQPDDRFRAAMFANNRTDRQVADSINNTYRQFWFFVGLTVLSIGFGIASLFIWGFAVPSFPLFDVIFRLIPLPVLGALTLRAGYTNWMFRRKRLDPLNAYLSSGDLLPRRVTLKSKSGGLPVKSASTVIKALVIVLAASLAVGYASHPNVAYAQSTITTLDPGGDAKKVVADPSSDDMFIQMLSYLMPGVGPIPNSTMTSPGQQHEATKTAFTIFSGTLMFIAAMVSGWQIMSGLVASAKEGTVLGKLYHEVWAPLRVVFGFGMLAPVAGGLCAAQVICLYLVVWGGNLANLVWEPYIEVVTYQDAGTSDARAQTTAENVVGANLNIANTTVKNVTDHEICWAVVDAYVKRTGDWNAAMMRTEDPEWQSWSPNAADWLMFNGDHDSRFIDYGSLCGKIEVQIPHTVDNPAEEVAARNIAIAMAKRQDAVVEQIQGQIRSSGIPAAIAQSYQNTASDTPRYFASNDPSAYADLTTLLQDARKSYLQSVADGAADSFKAVNPEAGGSNELDAFRKTAIKAGWSAAGVFYVSVARLQNAVYAGATSSPTYYRGDEINAQNFPIYLAQSLNGTQDNPGAVPSFDSWWNGNINNVAGDISSDAMMVASQSGMLGDMLNPIFMPAVNAWKHREDVNPLNPMQNMVDLGMNMMGWGGAAFIAANTVTGGLDAAQKTSDRLGPVGATWGWATDVAKSVLGSVMSLASMGAIALMVAGAVHAYVLPMIPYIMTVFFVSAMALLTAEALVAAPLWAFFHIRMDGQDFVSDVQKPGYMIAFNLILRPALMIFGLILSYLVFGAMAWFVEKTFFPAAAGLSQSAAVGPLGLIVLIIMVTYIHFQLAVRAFSMILQVPDRVTRWFGQGGERLGEEEDSHKISGFVVNSTARMEGIGKGGALARRAVPGVRGPKQPGGGGGEGTTGGPSGEGSGGGGGGGGGGEKPAGEA